MRKVLCTVGIAVEVFDLDALREAAKAKAVGMGMAVPDWEELRENSRSPVAFDLRTLLDHGVNQPGCRIEECHVTSHGDISS